MTMKHASDTNFGSQMSAQGLTVVDFGAAWCPPCKALLPLLNELDSEYGDTVSILKVDVDESPQVAARYGVMSMPTVMFFKDGEPVEKLIGLRSKDAYRGIIEKHI